MYENKIQLEKYIKHGIFKLHSGQTSNTLYDVKAMICDGKLPYIIGELNASIPMEIKYGNFTIVGIESAGAIIATYASYIHDWNLVIITKDNEIIGNVTGEYCLVDDVVTTENTIRKVIVLIGKDPSHIFCVVDRREISSLKINSVFKLKMQE